MSESTLNLKKIKRTKNLLGATSLTLNYGPIAGLFTYGMVTGTMVTKVVLPMFALVGIGLGIASAVFKKVKTSVVVWTLLIMFCMFISNIAWVVYAVGSCEIADSTVVQPLYKKQKTKLTINKEIAKNE